MQAGFFITLLFASTIVMVSSQDWMQNLLMMRMFSGGGGLGSSGRSGYDTVGSSAQRGASQGAYPASQQQTYNTRPTRPRTQNNGLGMIRMLALTGQMSDNMKRMMCLRPSTMQLCMMMNMF